jgi:DNA invertase Pin-like site-specific DNA recombinase
MRAVLYARTSTDDKGQNPEVQLVVLRTEASKRGWRVVAEHVDEGHSGAARDRPGLNAVMAAVNSGTCDVVMVVRLDRYARSLSHLVTDLDRFRDLGVDFVCVANPIDTTTPEGRALFGMTAVFAEYERELIKARVRTGMATAQAKGKHCGRPRKDVDISEARRLLAAGHSQRQVARKLNLSRRLLQRRLAEADGAGSKG